MRVTSSLLSLSLGVSALAHRLCHHVNVRLPPTIQEHQPAHWIPPPLGWDFGNWFQTNSSSANGFLRNLQYSTVPDDVARPWGKRTDLSSFQLQGNDTVLTSFGLDTPTRYPAVYEYAGTGIIEGATDFLQVLAWGVDCHGVGYRVSYSTFTELTQTPASIDVLSRTSKGPDAATLGEVRKALIAFGKEEIAALAKAMGPGVQDGGRDGMPPILQCDEQCRTNEDLAGIF